MKSKEEIEQLAEKHYTQITLSQRTAFKLGYTQCQEDMADKKYTEEDLIIAFDAGYYTRDAFGDRPNNMTAEEYINSLNKQDNE
jgi:hypothetical protein